MFPNSGAPRHHQVGDERAIGRAVEVEAEQIVLFGCCGMADVNGRCMGCPVQGDAHCLLSTQADAVVVVSRGRAGERVVLPRRCAWSMSTGATNSAKLAPAPTTRLRNETTRTHCSAPSARINGREVQARLRIRRKPDLLAPAMQLVTFGNPAFHGSGPVIFRSRRYRRFGFLWLRHSWSDPVLSSTTFNPVVLSGFQP